jgi:hypothetical protein
MSEVDKVNRTELSFFGGHPTLTQTFQAWQQCKTAYGKGILGVEENSSGMGNLGGKARNGSTDA